MLLGSPGTFWPKMTFCVAAVTTFLATALPLKLA
jgi:hypothetical protein